MFGSRRKVFCSSLLCAVLCVSLLSACASGAGTYVSQGMELIQNLDYQSALSCFDQAAAGGENARLVARGRGIAYMGLADYEQAIDCFEEALHLSRGLVEGMDYDLNYYLAAAYTKCGRFGDAEDTYNAILGMKADEEEAYFLRGNVRLSLKKVQQALEDFDQVIEMDPRNYNRLIRIFEVLDSYGHTEEGQTYLRAALEQQDGRMTVFDKGRIYYYLGEYQDAYLALEEARQQGGAEAYLYLGRAYEATGDYNYAANVYNAYLAQGVGNAEIYNQLGLCELQKGEYESALAAFQSGLALENKEMAQSLSYNEIVAYEYLGDYARAKLLMETYLQNYPDDEDAKREYTFLSTR